MDYKDLDADIEKFKDYLIQNGLIPTCIAVQCVDLQQETRHLNIWGDGIPMLGHIVATAARIAK